MARLYVPILLAVSPWNFMKETQSAVGIFSFTLICQMMWIFTICCYTISANNDCLNMPLFHQCSSSRICYQCWRYFLMNQLKGCKPGSLEIDSKSAYRDNNENIYYKKVVSNYHYWHIWNLTRIISRLIIWVIARDVSSSRHIAHHRSNIDMLS